MDFSISKKNALKIHAKMIRIREDASSIMYPALIQYFVYMQAGFGRAGPDAFARRARDLNFEPHKCAWEDTETNQLHVNSAEQVGER
jgi:hypothetical protein